LLAAVATVTRGAEARGAPAAPDWRQWLKCAKLWLVLAGDPVSRPAPTSCPAPALGHSCGSNQSEKRRKEKERGKDLRAKGGGGSG